MQKSIRFALNRFLITPHSLRSFPPQNVPAEEINVQLADLYHHYYLDSHGKAPPNPDPAQFEHLEFLLPCSEFRLRGDGIGVSKEIRRHRSNEFGHAFCRWFLYDHLNITYFAHMEHVLNRGLSKGFSGLAITRAASGNTPDYFCAEDVNKIYLAEAKGRHTNVSFASAEFATWRNQFNQVVVKDSSGVPRSVKGFIVATRFGTESKPTVKSTVFAEDPATPGDSELGPEQAVPMGRAVVSSHYAGIALKLGQPILATALANGFIVPEEIRYLVTVWEFQLEPLAKKRFVGGYFPLDNTTLPMREVDGKVRFENRDPFRLDVGLGTFFGVEENIFRQVAALTRGETAAATEVSRIVDVQPFYSGVSILRDGSIIAPLEFLTPVAREAI